MVSARGTIGNTTRSWRMSVGAFATGSVGNSTESRTPVRSPDWRASMDTPCCRPMMPPTPLRVKPKPS